MTVEKYGGYNKIKTAYFAFVEYVKGKNHVRSLEAIYIMDKQRYESDPLRFFTEKYARKDSKIQFLKILIPKIKINALFSFDGFRMNISSRSGDDIIYKNANQLVVAPEQAQYVKQLSRYLKRCKGEGRNVEITAFDGIDVESNIALYQLLMEKLGKTPYSIKYETPLRTLETHAQHFKELPLATQCKVLMEILRLFGTNDTQSDTEGKKTLESFCGKKSIGRAITSKNLSGYAGHSFLLIHQSVTGVFEKQIDLLGDEF